MTDRSEVNADIDAATLGWIDRFAPYGVIATDRELRVRSWNSWMETHSGLETKAVLGRKLTDLFPDIEKRRMLPQFERALRGEVSVISTALHSYLIPLQPPSRDLGFEWMKQTARIAPLITRNQIHGVIIVIEDVSQREWQSHILSERHARDEMLAWALAHFINTDDPRRVAREVFCKVAEHLDFEAYMLHLFDPEPGVFKLHASGGVAPESEAKIGAIPAAQIPWLADAKNGLPIVRENVQQSTTPNLVIARELGFRSHLVLPLVAGPTMLGLLTFASRTRDKISGHETELLSTMGQYLSVALNREKIDRELRAAQAKLNQHAQELEQNVADRTASLKQIIAELQTFSYTIAHDLRAPIRAIKGYCEALVEDFSDQLPADAAGMVQRLRNASLQMDALTRDLLEFSKISRQEISLSELDLTKVVEDTIALAGSRASACVQMERPLHTVQGNYTLVSQCVGNLIENGLKFCRPGIAPVLKIWSELIPHDRKSGEPETTHFSRSRYALPEPGLSESSAPRVRLWFKDNGIGISREAQGKIFGIFERGDRANEFEGTGIGLAIVARAMERMGGACGVQSEPGSGSSFWLEFRGIS